MEYNHPYEPLSGNRIVSAAFPAAVNVYLAGMDA